MTDQPEKPKISVNIPDTLRGNIRAIARELERELAARSAWKTRRIRIGRLTISWRQRQHKGSELHSYHVGEAGPEIFTKDKP